MAASEPAKIIEPFWGEVTGGSLAQGDFLPGCSVPLVSSDFDKAEGKETPVKVRVDVLDLIVMTQSCDLENKKAPLVACCPVHSILRFEEFTPKLQQKGEWERVRQGRIEGLHLLGSTSKPEDKWGAYVVDFRSIYSLPIAYMTARAESLGRHWRLRPPYLEHFSQAFARFFIALGSPRIFPRTTILLRGRHHRPQRRRWQFSKNMGGISVPSPSSSPTFQCDQCGRSMKWSPAIAGKRGRCKCGATVQVPVTIGAPVEAEGEEDLLSALEIPIRPIVQPTQYAHQPVLAAPLAYATPVAPARGAPAGVALQELAREFYIPAVVLVVGFGCILGWLANHGRFVFAAVVVVMFLAGLLMIGKTVALSLFAWFLARSNGGSFGHPLGTILKIAGLVVTLDAATLWAISGMVATGAITRRGGFYPIHTIVLLFLVTFVVALLIAHLVYRLDEDEAKLFGRFIAGGNLAINIVLVFILAVIGQSAVNARRARVASIAASPSGGSISASTPPSSGIVETAADRRIESRLSKGAMFIKDPQEWETSIVYGRKNIPVSNLLDKLSVAGASRIYVDTAVARAGVTRIYVDLPDTPQKRDACYAVAADWTQGNPRTIVMPQPPTAARFMQIDILR